MLARSGFQSHPPLKNPRSANVTLGCASLVNKDDVRPVSARYSQGRYSQSIAKFRVSVNVRVSVRVWL